jgi:glycolate oxidase iron-sulfur subunit
MHVRLAESLVDTPNGRQAAGILARCTHCGFCTATCPTYQLLGDELDSPRGRIYLIKQALEGDQTTAETQLHLDRCLTCRSCETTCPSGVQFGRLLDIGRRLVDERVPRSVATRVWRALLVSGLTGPLFKPALLLGQWLRPLLPQALRDRIPAPRSAGAWPTERHARKVLLLAGCVQPAMAPNINAATARVLNAVGIETVVAGNAGCCGALRQHLGQQAAALDDVRRNIDAWWPHIEAGAEAIVMNASGCGAMVSEYAHLLRDDAAYANRAARIALLTRDLSQLLEPFSVPLAALVAKPSRSERLVFHPPCSLQHGLGIRGKVEGLLTCFGAELLPQHDSHLCCGSAGSYSILQPAIATQLRARKLAALQAERPTRILSANVGCIAHLAGAAAIPVHHWIEWLDEKLTGKTLEGRG